MSGGEFSAVLLAGGQSRRMGRDKALLTLPDGRPLWQRQLDDVLRPLRPAALFFSGPARVGLPGDVTVLADAAAPAGQSLGPLAGIAAALDAMQTPLLLVLAVDLPAMTAAWFRDHLLPRCRPGRGAVPRGDDGFFEPLAAVYSQECRALAQAQLQSGTDRSLQSFVRAAESAGWIEPVGISAEAQRLFVNWNAPTDLEDPTPR